MEELFTFCPTDDVEINNSVSCPILVPDRPNGIPIVHVDQHLLIENRADEPTCNPISVIAGVGTPRNGAMSLLNRNRNLSNLLPIPRVNDQQQRLCTSGRKLPTIMVLNARSITNKVDELKIHIESWASDIIFVSETWLTENIPDGAIDIDGFRVIRKDRSVKRGGGVALFMKDNLPVKVRHDLSNGLFECLWVTLRPKWLPREISRFALACVYLPPSMSTNEVDSFYDYFQSCFDKLATESRDTAFIVAGDFNPSSNGFSPRLINNHCNFKQVVKEPTRNQSILDFIFTNVSHLYELPKTEAPLSTADHMIIVWKPKIRSRKKNVMKRFTVRPLKPAALDHFRSVLDSYSWQDVIGESSVDKKLEKFLTTTDAMINECFPEKTVKVHQKDRYFVTPKVKKVIRARNRAYKKGHAWEYRSLRNRAKKEIRAAKEKFYKDNVSESSWNTQKWWKKINELTGRNKKSSAITLNDPHCQTTMNEKATADYINNFLTSLTKDFSSVAPKWLEDNKDEQLPGVSNESVVVELSKLKIKKAPGLNDPNIKILKTFASSFAVPLTDIFNKSFEQKQFPTAWKKFLVVPIPKSVPCTSVEEVRPIALLSAISKIQESYAARWINEDIGGKISEMQFGGQPGSSAVLALFRLVHRWHLALLNPGTVIRITFLDFRKAYDLIDHNLLLENCSKIGIRPGLLPWLASYLNGRAQITKFGSQLSGVSTVNGGVPQGSKIGPLAFIVHINGLPSALGDYQNSTYYDESGRDDDVTIFMDDTTISEIIDVNYHVSGNVIGNSETNMRDVINFTKEQKMVLNYKKCKEMLIDFRRNKTRIPEIEIEGTSIQRVRSYKLLGLWLDDDLKWATNTEKITKKAAKRLFFLRMLKSYGAKPDDMKKFYTSVIRPTLEYAAQVWNGGLTKQQRKDIERIQRRAVKIIYDVEDYDEALRIAGIDSLQKRRDRMCVELVKGMSNPDHKLHHLLPRRVQEVRERDTRLNNQLFYNFQGRTDRFRNSPLSYAVNRYNELMLVDF